MLPDFEQNLEKLAHVAVRVGVNLRPGQRLMLGMPIFGTDGTPIETYPFVRKIVAAAYAAGARYVGVNWDDEMLQRIRVDHAAADTLSEFATWKNNAAIDYINNGDAIMAIFVQNPDLLEGTDPEKTQAKQKAEAEHFHAFFGRLATGATNWLMVAGATVSSAAKIFPHLPETEAVDRLWDAIFDACRIRNDDPVAVWEQHIADLRKRSDYLNNKKYTALKYTAPGTDLTVGLPEGHIWNSGHLTSQNGISYVANIPTEEVFTMPHKDRVDGVVTATKPLIYGGSLIEDFTLKFSEGVVVNATAKKGEADLNNLLNTDAASRSLGEVALVPHSSPISQSGLLFYNILIDENASNHIALGNAYRFSMSGGEGMSAEEFAAAGGNESMTHADFMVGSGAMNIDGITNDGSSEPIMRAGEWAFAV